MNHLLNFRMRLVYFLLIGLAYEGGLFYLDIIMKVVYFILTLLKVEMLN